MLAYSTENDHSTLRLDADPPVALNDRSPREPPQLRNGVSRWVECVARCSSAARACPSQPSAAARGAACSSSCLQIFSTTLQSNRNSPTKTRHQHNFYERGMRVSAEYQCGRRQPRNAFGGLKKVTCATPLSSTGVTNARLEGQGGGGRAWSRWLMEVVKMKALSMPTSHNIRA